MNKRTRFAAPFVLVILVLAIFTGSASAHECFIVNRSERGNAMAALHSPMWESVATLPEVFGFMHQFLGLPELSPTQLEYAVEEARAMGYPEQLVFFLHHTLMEGTPAETKNADNLKGVDHAFDHLTDGFMTIYMDALTQ